MGPTLLGSGRKPRPTEHLSMHQERRDYPGPGSARHPRETDFVKLELKAYGGWPGEAGGWQTLISPPAASSSRSQSTGIADPCVTKAVERVPSARSQPPRPRQLTRPFAGLDNPPNGCMLALRRHPPCIRPARATSAPRLDRQLQRHGPTAPASWPRLAGCWSAHLAPIPSPPRLVWGVPTPAVTGRAPAPLAHSTISRMADPGGTASEGQSTDRSV